MYVTGDATAVLLRLQESFVCHKVDVRQIGNNFGVDYLFTIMSIWNLFDGSPTKPTMLNANLKSKFNKSFILKFMSNHTLIHQICRYLGKLGSQTP
jgi:hypothetical protein